MDSNESRARALLGDLSAVSHATALHPADTCGGATSISTALRRTAR